MDTSTDNLCNESGTPIAAPGRFLQTHKQQPAERGGGGCGVPCRCGRPGGNRQRGHGDGGGMIWQRLRWTARRPPRARSPCARMS